ncbi:MAG TPA: hypothetical protein VGH54_10370 [Mycobacterium sp.]|jgi:hypothetical protein|uniref:hypothetical protein n=1 Tax=Mycobacterium sp. TaxID=1785 RepID=UPI002F3F4DD8
MTSTLVIGIDPGPTTGIVALLFSDVDAMSDPVILQCDHYSTMFFADVIAHGFMQPTKTIVAVEQFVVGPRSGRSGSAEAGRITRNLIGALSAEFGDDVVLRAAGQVKPWATDRKLAAAGLLDPTAGMGHARDAARHALYAAVQSGFRDPMSKAALR